MLSAELRDVYVSRTGLWEPSVNRSQQEEPLMCESLPNPQALVEVPQERTTHSKEDRQECIPWTAGDQTVELSTGSLQVRGLGKINTHCGSLFF